MANKPQILVIQGPNLNMLGKREPDIYGALSLAELNFELDARAGLLGLELCHLQSNHEGALIDKLHACYNRLQGIIINPGGLTHTSVALRDALVMHTCPKIEVHISNIHQREKFRHVSLIADIVSARMEGFGTFGYHLALDGLAEILNSST